MDESLAENKENINLDVTSDTLKLENNVLKDKLKQAELRIEELENCKLLNATMKELEEAKLFIEKIVTDLEIQMNDCFEMNSKINELMNSEQEFHKSLKNVVLEAGKPINDDESISELFVKLKQVLVQNRDNTLLDDSKVDSLNDSIFDLDLFQSDVLCLKEETTFEKEKTKASKSKLPKLQNPRKSSTLSTSFILTSESCFSLDSKDYGIFALKEEIDKLEWDETDDITHLVERSFAIFAQSIIGSIDRASDEIVSKLKELVNEFCLILTTKVKTLQMKQNDLNSTSIFEKLEQQFQSETSDLELKEQLEMALKDKEQVCSDLKGLKEENKEMCLKLDQYQDLEETLKEQKEFNVEKCNELRRLQYQLDSFQKENSEFERSLNVSNEAVETYKSKFQECQTEIDKITMENSMHVLTAEELKNVKENLVSVSEELTNAKERIQMLTQDLSENNHTINRLTNDFENRNTGDIVHICNSKESEETTNEMVDQLLSVKSDNINLLTRLNNLTLELETAVEDYLKISEELDELKSKMSDTNEQLELASTQYDTEIKRLHISHQALVEELQLEIVKKNRLLELGEELSVQEKAVRNQMEMDLKMKEIELETLRKNLDNSNELESFERENEILRNKIDSQYNSISVLEAEKDDLMLRNGELSVKLEQAMETTENVKKDSEAKDVTLLNLTNQMESNIAELKLKISITEQELKNCTDELEKNDIATLELQSKGDSMDNVTKIESLQTELERCKNLLLDKESEVTTLRENAGTMELNMEQLQNEWVALKSEHNQLQFELTNKEGTQIELAFMEKEINRLTVELQAVCEELELAQAKSQLLEINATQLDKTVLDKIERFEEEISVLKAELRNKENIILDLSNQMELNTAGFMSTKQELLVAQEQTIQRLDTLKLTNNKAKETETRLCNDLLRALSEKENLHSQLKTCQNALIEKENNSQGFQEAMEMCEMELSALRTKLGKTKSDLHTKEKELIQLKCDFDSLSTEMINEKRTNQKLREIQLESNNKLEDGEMKIKRLGSEVQRLEMQLSHSKRLGNESSNYLSNTKEIEELKSIIKEKSRLNEQLKESVKTFDSLVQHYNDLKTRYRSKRVQVETMEEAIGKLKNENEQLRKSRFKEEWSKLS